jgi:hypothetical protein
MMMRGTLALLLFSFLLVFSTGCNRENTTYGELVQRGEYQAILDRATRSLAKQVDAGDLYWLALAHYGLGNEEEAAQTLTLHFALLGDHREPSAGAQTLAVLLPDPDLAIRWGRVLEAEGRMEETTALSFYRALLSRGLKEEANSVFATYLRDTVDPLSYAQALIDSDADPALIRRAFEVLELPKQVDLLIRASERANTLERALHLLPIADEVEALNLDSGDRIRLYSAMATLYGQADLRVQANKYRSLAATR